MRLANFSVLQVSPRAPSLSIFSPPSILLLLLLVLSSHKAILPPLPPFFPGRSVGGSRALNLCRGRGGGGGGGGLMGRGRRGRTRRTHVREYVCDSLCAKN